MKIFVSIRLMTLVMVLLCSHLQSLKAQTDLDYDMMAKNQFCTGFTYTYSSWDHYWEGTHKRDNANLGRVSTQMLAWMGNYGISKKLNVLFSLPYIKTKASAGTLHGMQGLQDLSLFVKWKPVTLQAGSGKFSIIGVGGFSFPVSDYVADHLPLALGVRSKNLIARAILDYQVGSFFATGSASYVYRSNINIDRDAYFTTEMHQTSEVQMPDAASFNARMGYRGKNLRAEVVLNNWTTQGGFDITKNNMPFPSNKMNMTSTGVSLRFVPEGLSNLSLTAEGNYTLAGRNAGQATAFSVGAFYIFSFSRKPISIN